MTRRPGLDDSPHVERLAALWLEGSAEIDTRLASINRSIQVELGRNEIRAARLRAEAARLVEVQAVAEHILDDALGQTQEFAQNQMGVIYEQGARRLAGVPFSMTQPHRAAVQVLADDFFEDVLEATRFVDDSAKVFVRRVSRRLVAAAATTGSTNRQQAKQLAREMRREFATRGVGAVTYRDGSKRSFGEYADMLIRTKTGVAYNAGTLNQSRLAGVTHFEILDGSLCGLTAHHDPMLANGLIVDLYTAQAWPLSHPNCRRAINPRPDLNAQNAGFAEPTVTPEARADQTAFEEALRAQARNRSASAARTRPVRPSNSRPARASRPTRPQRRRSTAAQRSAARAGNARRREQIEQARSEARVARARFNEQRTAVAGPADSIPDGVLDRWGVTPDQYRNARAVTAKLKADIRQTADREAADLGTWLFNNDLSQMTRPDRLQRRTDVFGNTNSVRTQSGYDWMEGLDAAELARVRRRFTDFDQLSPDVVADQVRRKTTFDFSDEEAIDWLVDRWLHEDGLRSLASGRLPKYANADNLLPGDYALDGYQLDKLFGVDVDEAAGHVARVQADAGEAAAQRILGSPSRGPAPWEMDMGDYLRELEALEDVLSAGPNEPARLRLLELAPSEIDVEGSMNPFELFEEIRVIAQTAGRL